MWWESGLESWPWRGDGVGLFKERDLKKKKDRREGRANKSQIRVGLARLENGLNFRKKFSFRQV